MLDALLCRSCALSIFFTFCNDFLLLHIWFSCVNQVRPCFFESPELYWLQTGKPFELEHWMREMQRERGKGKRGCHAQSFAQAFTALCRLIVHLIVRDKERESKGTKRRCNWQRGCRRVPGGHRVGRAATMEQGQTPYCVFF